MSATRTVWETKDGQRIHVKDMTDGHLINTVRFLHRNAELLRLSEASRMSQFAYLVGDGADDAIDFAVADLAEMSDGEFLSELIPTYDCLVSEIKKRGLEACCGQFIVGS